MRSTSALPSRTVDDRLLRRQLPPDNTVTLEEACTMALRLLGYDVAKLGGTFPTAQLSKASALGLRNEINARQGETLTLEQGTMLFYNALTAMNGSGQVYASTLGFAVNNGQVDISSVLLDNVKGPFVQMLPPSCLSPRRPSTATTKSPPLRPSLPMMSTIITRAPAPSGSTTSAPQAA